MTHKLALLLLGLAQQLGEGGEAGHRQLLHENAHQVLQTLFRFHLALCLHACIVLLVSLHYHFLFEVLIILKLFLKLL